MKLYKSKTKSETTGEPYIVRVVMGGVEWIDNPNAPKESTAPLLMTIVQRMKLKEIRPDSEHKGVWYENDIKYRPFGIWSDNFTDFFEPL